MEWIFLLILLAGAVGTILFWAAAVALAFGQKDKSAGARSQQLSKTFKTALIKNMNLDAAQINQLPDIYQVDAHGNLFVSDNAVFRLFSLVSEMRASQATKSAA